MMMPIAVGLFDRHPPSVLRHRLRHRRVDLAHRHPVAYPRPHAEVRASLAQLGEERGAGKAAVGHQRPAYASGKGVLELLEERQRRCPEAPFRPRIRDDRPASRERAAGGCVANFAQKVMKEQLPLSVWGLRIPRQSDSWPLLVMV